MTCEGRPGRTGPGLNGGDLDTGQNFGPCIHSIWEPGPTGVLQGTLESGWTAQVAKSALNYMHLLFMISESQCMVSSSQSAAGQAGTQQ